MSRFLSMRRQFSTHVEDFILAVVLGIHRDLGTALRGRGHCIGGSEMLALCVLLRVDAGRRCCALL